MRILYSRTQFWFDLKAGGSVAHTAGVIKGLTELCSVEIISNDTLHGVDGIPTTIIKPYIKKELLYNIRFAPAIKQKIRSFEPDFVYHRYSGTSIATSLACRRTGTPLVLEFNGSDVWVFKHWLKHGKGLRARLNRAVSRPILEYNERFNLDSAFLIVVVSDPLRNTLIELGIPESRILVNPNGTDPGKFKTAPDDVCWEVKQTLEIPSDRTVIGFSGTFGRWHGIPELSAAITSINRDSKYRDKVSFVLYGDGELREE
ncbi:glycosyltransferase, partial [Candidatus Latescibacterota bacterium]